MADDNKNAWLSRVLGVAATGGAKAAPGKPGAFDEAKFRKDFRAALLAFQSESEAVEAQINLIRLALLETSDPALHRIAEFGLNGITGTRKVGLQKALREIEAAQGEALVKQAGKAAAIAEEYRGFITSDRRVIACDMYPKIQRKIGPSLGDALGALAAALRV